MKPYSISQLARLCGLSRSTLLYYDRIGLLRPSGRTDTGYRLYTAVDRDRLERICRFRQAGLSLDDIRKLLISDGEPSSDVLEKRFREIGTEISELKAKQGLLSHMLKNLVADAFPQKVDKALWVEMLRSAGMDDQAMERWHREFEARAPEAHHQFLLSLGIPEQETLEIRKWSQKLKTWKEERARNQKRFFMIEIRKETRENIPAIRVINERAFEQPAEANVVDKLRESCPGLLSLVAVLNGQVVGHILFSPALIDNNGISY